MFRVRGVAGRHLSGPCPPPPPAQAEQVLGIKAGELAAMKESDPERFTRTVKDAAFKCACSGGGRGGTVRSCT